MAIQIRLLKISELHLANEFFNKSYKTNRTMEAFDWEFINAPVGSSIYVAAFDTAKENEEIIGIQCAIPLDFVTSEGQIIRTAKSEDTLVNPNYRGQNIFEKMYNLLFDECEKNGITYIWGFTPAFKPFQKLGFSLEFKSNQGLFVTKITSSYKFISNLNPKNRLREKVKIWSLCVLSKFKSFSAFSINESDFEIRELPTLLSTFLLTNNYFVPNNSSQLTLHLNEKYLNWRVRDNQYENNYKCFEFSNQNKICAHVIINRIKQIGYIEQIIFDVNLSEKSKLEILKSTILILKNQDVSCIRFLGFDQNITNRAELELIKRIGFIIVKRGNWFVWKSLNKNFTHRPQDVFISRLFTQGNN